MELAVLVAVYFNNALLQLSITRANTATHASYTCNITDFFLCALPKLVLADDAMLSGVQLFSSAPGYRSSCLLVPWLSLQHLPSCFSRGRFPFIFPSTVGLQFSANSLVLEHVLSSWLDFAWWCGPENVRCSCTDSIFPYLTHVLSSWAYQSCARSTSQKLYVWCLPFLESRFLSHKELHSSLYYSMLQHTNWRIANILIICVLCVAKVTSKSRKTVQSSQDHSATWGPIHWQCHKIYFMICFRTIATRKLRYPEMIIYTTCLKSTDLAIIKDKFCEFNYDMS